MPDYQTSRIKTPRTVEYHRPAQDDPSWSREPAVRKACGYGRVLGTIWAVLAAAVAIGICVTPAVRMHRDKMIYPLSCIFILLQFALAYWLSAYLIARERRWAIVVMLIYNYVALVPIGLLLVWYALLAVTGYHVARGEVGWVYLAAALLFFWLLAMVRAAVALHRAWEQSRPGW